MKIEWVEKIRSFLGKAKPGVPAIAPATPSAEAVPVTPPSDGETQRLVDYVVVLGLNREDPKLAYRINKGLLLCPLHADFARPLQCALWRKRLLVHLCWPASRPRTIQKWPCLRPWRCLPSRPVWAPSLFPCAYARSRVLLTLACPSPETNLCNFVRQTFFCSTLSAIPPVVEEAAKEARYSPR